MVMIDLSYDNLKSNGNERQRAYRLHRMKSGLCASVCVWYKKLCSDAKHRSKKRETLFDLTPDLVKGLWDNQNGKCFWLGIDMNITDIKNHPFKPSLDRIDSSKGYTQDNVVLCTVFANLGRKETDFNTFSECMDVIKNKN